MHSACTLQHASKLLRPSTHGVAAVNKRGNSGKKVPAIFSSARRFRTVRDHLLGERFIEAIVLMAESRIGCAEFAPVDLIVPSMERHI